MKIRLKILLRTALAVVLSAGFSSTLLAQGNATTPIVVVDLAKVFDQHPTFKQQIDQIKAAVKASEADFKARGQDIESRVAKLKTFKPTSEEYIRLETETARIQAQIQADMSLKRKDFLEQEAMAYYSAYQEVKQEIKEFAESNRIGLVLRFSSEVIDPSNRQSVMQGVNQPIVYNQAGLDITKYIMDRLHRKSAGAQRTAQTPQGTRAPTGGAPQRR